ncbi:MULTISPECIES: lycopene cyclase domain-containing protein [Brachybacterium]|nr:lycopene cyclase domain-containing protein [Brachybacterium sp. p3-SID1565]
MMEFVTSWAYLAAIIASSGCMLLLDHRFRLYLFRDRRRALRVQAAGVGLLLVWDLVCIALGVFARGEGPYLSGYEIVPHLTIEEPFFLWFLCHLTMVVATGADRLLCARAGGRDGAAASGAGSAGRTGAA